MGAGGISVTSGGMTKNNWETLHYGIHIKAKWWHQWRQSNWAGTPAQNKCAQTTCSLCHLLVISLQKLLSRVSQPCVKAGLHWCDPESSHSIIYSRALSESRDTVWRIDLKEILRITYSVEFVRHLHQLLVHLDPDVLALKHSGQREQITNEPSAVTCRNKLFILLDERHQQ